MINLIDNSNNFYDTYINNKSNYIRLLITFFNHSIDSINYTTEYDELNNNINNLNGIWNAMGGAPSNKKKWDTLEHNGVMFYPEYIPHNIPITYDDGISNQIIHLNPTAEEFITYYVNKRFDKYRNDRFNKNFFNDWKELLNSEIKNKIKDFSKCNFDDIKAHVITESEKNKQTNNALSKEEKEGIKKKKEEENDKYKYVIVDGKKQVIDNFLVEPPTIFVGRGSHPLSGRIKNRIYPNDIILNVGKDMRIPVPNVIINEKNEDLDKNITAKDRWGDIITDNFVEWIASWQNNVTGKYNYARFGRKSDFKMKSDEEKYDKARLLKKKINKIRAKNELNMNSTDLETKQLATALFLIDRLALRIGNEKKEDEADTVGVSTLKIKNVSLLDNFTIKLDFLGKDSIRYVNKFKVPEIVYNNIKEFHIEMNPDKTNNDLLFDAINSDALNKYIKKFMKKLTSKVFRTFNASYLMQIELKKITTKYKDYDKPDKVEKIQHEYEMANLKVAKLCNHQKLSTNTSSTSSTDKMEKINNKIKELQLKLNKYKRQKDKKIEKNQKTTAINKKITNQQEKIKRMKNKKTLQQESKSLSSGTSKTNYIDPRITIAFLKANSIMDNIDKFFNKTYQTNFQWAMNVDENFKW